MRRECRERFPPPPTSKETADQRSRHASRHVRHVRAVMHVRIAYLCLRGKVPGIPGACAPTDLRIWQEAHKSKNFECTFYASSNYLITMCARP